MQNGNRLPVALLGLRLSVFLVMLVWTLDKFLRRDMLAACFALYLLRDRDTLWAASKPS